MIMEQLWHSAKFALRKNKMGQLRCYSQNLFTIISSRVNKKNRAPHCGGTRDFRLSSFFAYFLTALFGLLILLADHFAGESHLGLLELEELFLAQDFGELLEVLGFNLALAHPGG